MTDYADYRRALAEAQAWVVARLGLGNPAESLRSEELGACLSGYPDEWLYSEIKVDEVKALIARRREILLGMTSQPLPSSGKILCCFKDWDLAMGESVDVSKNVIDDAYLPPWDTWFAVLTIPQDQVVLLAWIPEELTDLVQNAIKVAATQPIGWLDEAVSGTWPDMSGYLYIGEGYPEASRAALAEVLSSLSP